jgi:hypothetical protein
VCGCGCSSRCEQSPARAPHLSTAGRSSHQPPKHPCKSPFQDGSNEPMHVRIPKQFANPSKSKQVEILDSQAKGLHLDIMRTDRLIHHFKIQRRRWLHSSAFFLPFRLIYSFATIGKSNLEMLYQFARVVRGSRIASQAKGHDLGTRFGPFRDPQLIQFWSSGRSE